MNTKITGEDNMFSALVKLSEGNLGALKVCTELYKHTEDIDPDALMGGLTHMLSLDTYNIYGSEIWMLYKDVCGENIIKTIACLRACQFGLIYETDLKHAIKNNGNGIDVGNIVSIVQQRLPAFAKDAKNEHN